ncbi:MAG: hypothetical protein HQL30_02350, partial [Candidatus Omnitrophica bacterium]|nr:hypothetical protein [Candidatus Omnitrophota bacterium]
VNTDWSITGELGTVKTDVNPADSTETIVITRDDLGNIASFTHTRDTATLHAISFTRNADGQVITSASNNGNSFSFEYVKDQWDIWFTRVRDNVGTEKYYRVEGYNYVLLDPAPQETINLFNGVVTYYDEFWRVSKEVFTRDNIYYTYEYFSDPGMENNIHYKREYTYTEDQESGVKDGTVEGALKASYEYIDTHYMVKREPSGDVTTLSVDPLGVSRPNTYYESRTGVFLIYNWDAGNNLINVIKQYPDGTVEITKPRNLNDPIWPVLERMIPDSVFTKGVNVPWVTYGYDLGGDAGLSRNLALLYEKLDPWKGNDIRFFAFCDLRAGMDFAPDGTPLAFTDKVYEDFQALSDAAGALRMNVTPVLFDFHLGLNRPDLLTDPVKRAALIDLYRPFIDRFKNDPNITGFEIMNEPENSGVPKDAYLAFIREFGAMIHEVNNSSATPRVGLEVTVGNMNRESMMEMLRYWKSRSLSDPLTRLQYHYYAYMEGSASKLSHALTPEEVSLVNNRNIDVGELDPTIDTTAGLGTVFANGDSGAFLWRDGVTFEITPEVLTAFRGWLHGTRVNIEYVSDASTVARTETSSGYDGNDQSIITFAEGSNGEELLTFKADYGTVPNEYYTYTWDIAAKEVTVRKYIGIYDKATGVVAAELDTATLYNTNGSTNTDTRVNSWVAKNITKDGEYYIEKNASGIDTLKADYKTAPNEYYTYEWNIGANQVTVKKYLGTYVKATGVVAGELDTTTLYNTSGNTNTDTRTNGWMPISVAKTGEYYIEKDSSGIDKIKADYKTTPNEYYTYEWNMPASEVTVKKYIGVYDKARGVQAAELSTTTVYNTNGNTDTDTRVNGWKAKTQVEPGVYYIEKDATGKDVLKADYEASPNEYYTYVWDTAANKVTVKKYIGTYDKVAGVKPSELDVTMVYATDGDTNTDTRVNRWKISTVAKDGEYYIEKNASGIDTLKADYKSTPNEYYTYEWNTVTNEVTVKKYLGTYSKVTGVVAAELDTTTVYSTSGDTNTDTRVNGWKTKNTAKGGEYYIEKYVGGVNDGRTKVSVDLKKTPNEYFSYEWNDAAGEVTVRKYVGSYDPATGVKVSDYESTTVYKTNDETINTDLKTNGWDEKSSSQPGQYLIEKYTNGENAGRVWQNVDFTKTPDEYYTYAWDDAKGEVTVKKYKGDYDPAVGVKVNEYVSEASYQTNGQVIEIDTAKNGWVIAGTKQTFFVNPDVSGEGDISPVDVLGVINEIARSGPIRVTSLNEKFDLNKDGFITADDVELLVDYLNAHAGNTTSGEWTVTRVTAYQWSDVLGEVTVRTSVSVIDSAGASVGGTNTAVVYMNHGEKRNTDVNVNGWTEKSVSEYGKYYIEKFTDGTLAGRVKVNADYRGTSDFYYVYLWDDAKGQVSVKKYLGTYDPLRGPVVSQYRSTTTYLTGDEKLDTNTGSNGWIEIMAVEPRAYYVERYIDGSNKGRVKVSVDYSKSPDEYYTYTWDDTKGEVTVRKYVKDHDPEKGPDKRALAAIITYKTNGVTGNVNAAANGWEMTHMTEVYYVGVDVNGDGQVTALDALNLINYINKYGVMAVTSGAEDLDVNGDGTISAIDVLQVINFINKYGVWELKDNCLVKVEYEFVDGKITRKIDTEKHSIWSYFSDTGLPSGMIMVGGSVDEYGNSGYEWENANYYGLGTPGDKNDDIGRVTGITLGKAGSSGEIVIKIAYVGAGDKERSERGYTDTAGTNMVMEGRFDTSGKLVWKRVYAVDTDGDGLRDDDETDTFYSPSGLIETKHVSSAGADGVVDTRFEDCPYYDNGTPTAKDDYGRVIELKFAVAGKDRSLSQTIVYARPDSDKARTVYGYKNSDLTGLVVEYRYNANGVLEYKKEYEVDTDRDLQYTDNVEYTYGPTSGILKTKKVSAASPDRILETEYFEERYFNNGTLNDPKDDYGRTKSLKYSSVDNDLVLTQSISYTDPSPAGSDKARTVYGYVDSNWKLLKVEYEYDAEDRMIRKKEYETAGALARFTEYTFFTDSGRMASKVDVNGVKTWYYNEAFYNNNTPADPKDDYGRLSKKMEGGKTFYYEAYYNGTDLKAKVREEGPYPGTSYYFYDRYAPGGVETGYRKVADNGQVFDIVKRNGVDTIYRKSDPSPQGTVHYYYLWDDGGLVLKNIPVPDNMYGFTWYSYPFNVNDANKTDPWVNWSAWQFSYGIGDDVKARYSLPAWPPAALAVLPGAPSAQAAGEGEYSPAPVASWVVEAVARGTVEAGDEQAASNRAAAAAAIFAIIGAAGEGGVEKKKEGDGEKQKEPLPAGGGKPGKVSISDIVKIMEAAMGVIESREQVEAPAPLAYEKYVFGDSDPVVRMLKEGKEQVLARISVEDLRALKELNDRNGAPMSLPDLVDWLKALNKFSGFYLELYSSSDFSGRVDKAVYEEFGLGEAADKIASKDVENLKASKNTINIMNRVLFDGTDVLENSLHRTIVMPVRDAENDPTGLIRGIFFGLRLVSVKDVEGDKDPVIVDIANKFNGWMRALGYEGDDILIADDIGVLLRPRNSDDFKGLIDRIFTALDKMTPVNMNEMVEVFRAARQLVTAL